MDVKNPLLRWVDRVLTRMPAMESERQAPPPMTAAPQARRSESERQV
jgi:hypothetical protein